MAPCRRRVSGAFPPLGARKISPVTHWLGFGNRQGPGPSRTAAGEWRWLGRRGDRFEGIGKGGCVQEGAGRRELARAQENQSFRRASNTPTRSTSEVGNKLHVAGPKNPRSRVGLVCIGGDTGQGRVITVVPTVWSAVGIPPRRSASSGLASRGRRSSRTTFARGTVGTSDLGLSRVQGVLWVPDGRSVSFTLRAVGGPGGVDLARPAGQRPGARARQNGRGGQFRGERENFFLGHGFFADHFRGGLTWAASTCPPGASGWASGCV